MGLIDNLRKVSGQIKNRLASAIGALRGITVSATRARRGVRFAARATRLTTPLGLGLTAVSFAPEIIKGVRTAGRFLGRAIPRGVAFVGGQRVVSGIAGGAGAGAVAGSLQSRKSGRPAQVQTLDPRSAAERNRDIERAFKADRARGIPASGRVTRRRKPSVKPRPRKRKAPTRRVRRKRKPVRRRKKRTHRTPRHKGHKRVAFTTSTGQKVSFLAKKVPPRHPHR